MRAGREGPVKALICNAKRAARIARPPVWRTCRYEKENYLCDVAHVKRKLCPVHGSADKLLKVFAIQPTQKRRPRSAD